MISAISRMTISPLHHSRTLMLLCLYLLSLPWLGIPIQARAQLGTSIADCAQATTVEDFVSLFGRGLCLNNSFNSSRGWVFTDPNDQTVTVPDPPDPFPLPVIQVRDNLEFRAEAVSINNDEPDKFYIASVQIANLPPFQRPVLPHPEVIGPFFYGTTANPQLVTLDQVDLTRIFDMQTLGSQDNRVVILQHGAGFDFNNPGVERFTGVRFEQNDDPVVKLNELCPPVNRQQGGVLFELELSTSEPDQDLTGYSVRLVGNDGNSFLDQPLSGTAINSLFTVIVDVSAAGTPPVFGIIILDPSTQVVDSATFVSEGGTVSPILSQILDNPFEQPALLSIFTATAWTHGEKLLRSNLGSYNKPADCGLPNRLYAINEYDVIDAQDSTSTQFVEIYSDQKNASLDGLILTSFGGDFGNPDAEPTWVLNSLDLDAFTTNAQGYALIPVSQFLTAFPNVAHAVGIYQRDQPVAPGSSLDAIRQLEYSFDEYKLLTAENNPQNIRSGNEYGNHAAVRDSLQSCPDASALMFGNDDVLPWIPTPGSVNLCADSRPMVQTQADTPAAADVADPVNAATGEFYTGPLIDLDLGGPLPLRFVRRYAAFLADTGRVDSPLGPNWMHDFELQLRRPDNDMVEITYVGGQLLRFSREASTGNWRLVSSPRIPFQLAETGDVFRLMDPSRNQVFTFNAFNVSTLSFGRLESIEDRNGNRLEVSYLLFVGGSRTIDRISDSLGRELTFTYTDNQLTGISDGVRTIGFSYSNGILTASTDAAGQTTSYQYDTSTTHGPLMTAMVRPNGNTPFTQAFASDGTVTSQSDAFGSPTDIQLDTPTVGQTTVTDLDGSVIFNHDAVDRTSIGIQGRDGQSAQFNLDVNGQLSEILDRETGSNRGVTRREYDPVSGKLLRFTNAQGDVTTFGYALQSQSFGSAPQISSFNFYNLTTITDALGNTITYSHDPFGNPLTRADETGQTRFFLYNAQGLNTLISNPAGTALTRDYNPDGTVASMTLSGNDPIIFEYDSLKRLIRILPPQTSEPGPPSIVISYDENNRVLAITDAAGQQVGQVHDGNGNRTAIIDPDGLQTRFAYDALDALNQITDRRGGVSMIQYDALRRPQLRSDADGVSILLEYNLNDDVVSVSNGLSTLSIERDAEGVATAVVSPLGHRTELESDLLGRITAVTNPLNQRIERELDPLGRVVESRLPDGRSTQYQYDQQDSLVAISQLDSAQQAILSASFGYNPAGKLTDLTDPIGGLWQFTQSPGGRVTRQQDPLLRGIDYSHDARGRLSQIDFDDGAQRTLEYDANSNLVSSQDSVGPNLSFQYDNQNRFIATAGISLVRDAEGSIVQTLSNGITYDASYTPGGRLASVSYLNGLFDVIYDYDPITGELVQISDTLTGTTILRVHDLDRRLIRIERSNGTETLFEYDDADRLTRITGRDAVTQTPYLDLQYSLNTVGDVIASQELTPLAVPANQYPIGVQTLSVDAASQINSPGFSHDVRGRRTAGPQLSYQYDGANRLQQLGPHSLGYNGLGDLTGLTTSGQLNNRDYHAAIAGRPMVAERNSSGPLRYYVHTPDGELLYLIDASDGNAVHHYEFDRTGSTRVLTDDQGAVSEAYAYLPYGQKLAQLSGHSQPFTFNGQFGVQALDPEGRHYQMRARVYDAQTARFVTREPVWPLILDPDLLNPYQFARQNPLNVADPSGLLPSRIERSPRTIQASLRERARNGAELLKLFSNFTDTDLVQYAIVESPRRAGYPPIQSIESGRTEPVATGSEEMIRINLDTWQPWPMDNLSIATTEGREKNQRQSPDKPKIAGTTRTAAPTCATTNKPPEPFDDQAFGTPFSLEPNRLGRLLVDAFVRQAEENGRGKRARDILVRRVPPLILNDPSPEEQERQRIDQEFGDPEDLGDGNCIL